jgi:hypothetical protein
MSSPKLSVPVALFIYNRPAFARRILSVIGAAKPRQLLIVADGPRGPEDQTRCQEARRIIDQIDWDCEVATNFSERNLGCRERISSGISWVFGQCEEAIILEDDTLPNPTFFPFCAELLERYRDQERVMMVAGQSFAKGMWPNRYSYYFSMFPLIWGWATWRRAWRYYDVDLKEWPKLRDSDWLERILGEPGLAAAWRSNFDLVARRGVDTWDYQWTFTGWLRDGLVAVPNVNLVSNIGFGDEATHTRKEHSHLANLSRQSIEFPLRHPPRIVVDVARDRRASWRMRGHGPSTRARQVFERLLRWLRQGLRASVRRLKRDD